MRRRAARWALGGACALAGLAPALAAPAVVIGFAVVDLPDAEPGRDLWRYSYWLDEFPYEASCGFTVYFDPFLYGELSEPPAVGVDWDLAVVQPDPGLPDPGFFDAEARFDQPAVSTPFRVTFEWNGVGTPGAQPYEVFDPSAAAVESGTTLPEPGRAAAGAAALLGLAALELARRGARRRPGARLAAALALALAASGCGEAWQTASGTGASAPLAAGASGPVVHQRPLGAVVLRFWVSRRERLDRTRFEYAFDASVQNGGATLLQGAVLVSSSRADTRVVDACVPFGPTPPGITRPGDDPFVLSQDRTVPFDPAVLSFQIMPVADPALCGDPGRVTLRRLNRSEYDHSVHELLGTSQQPAADFPADDYGYGFDTIGDVLALSPLLFEKHERAATLLVEEALRVFPDEPLSPRYEAEAAAHECGGATGSAWNLWSECALVVDAPIEWTGDYEIRVAAWGHQAGPDPARMQIRIDGAALGAEIDVTATAAGPGLYARRARLDEGVRAVGVEFTNDFYEPPYDRNLVVDWVEVYGPLDPPPTPPGIAALRALCDPALVGRAACSRQILRAFARGAWRRPLLPDEVEALGRLADLAALEGDDFDRGLDLGMRAILLSPHYVFRPELDPHPRSAEVHPLDDHELAVRLAYFLWSSPPDLELMQRADQGSLGDPAEIAAQVHRMVQDPRVQRFVGDFAGQWLRTRALGDLNPDYAYFPSWDAELAEAMRLETHLFLLEFVQQPVDFLGFFDADWSYLNDRLAQHYGLPAPGGPVPRRVTLPGDGRRGGIFTHGSVLAVTSQPRRTSPVKRGKWALDELLCIDIPPPPAGVEGMLDQGTPTGTLRERLEAHRARPECAACHDYLDPIGLGLENYDAIGAWRSYDNGEPVDASGAFPDGRTFSGPGEMAALVKADQNTLRCVAERTLIYALGRGLEPSDESHLDRIEAAFRAGRSFESLLVAIAQSEPYRMRRGEASGGSP